MTHDNVLVGTELVDLPNGADLFLRRKMGNFLHVWADANEERFRRTLRWLKRNRIFFHLGGQRLPPYLRGRAYDAMAREMGELFLGRYIDTELGWLVYAPRDCMDELAATPAQAKKPGQNTHQIRGAKHIPGATDMADARNHFIRAVRSFIGEARRQTPRALIHSVESSTLQKYLLQAGADVPSLELMPGETRLALSAVRGCARGYGCRRWYSHVATCCYGGFECELRPKRWKISLYESYIAGAPVIYFEGCNWRTDDYKRGERRPWGRDMYVDNRFRKYQKILSDFYAFTRKDQRPSGGPMAPLGLLHGNLDGWCGMWDKRVWGQSETPEWEYGDAENGWDHFYDLYDRTRWDAWQMTANQNRTGHPPCGQVDIVPVESRIDALRKYRALACIGWNTMTPGIYRKLKSFVRSGGRLLMFAPQLSTHLKRSGPFRMIRGGDVSDLFGVRILGKSKRWSVGARFVAQPEVEGFDLPVDNPPTTYRDAFCVDGKIPLAEVRLTGARMLACECKGGYAVESAPILTEYRLGRGYAYMVASWCYPGHPALRSLTSMLLKSFSIAHQDKDLRVFAPSQVTYGVYPDGRRNRKVYLLNTDTELEATVRLESKGKSKRLTLRAAECRACSV